MIHGGALGVDQWAAQAAIDADLQTIAYVPFPQQADAWTPEEQTIYHDVIDKAVQVKIFGDSPDNSWYFVRNHAIVDSSDIMLAVYPQGSKDGGSFATMKYALSQNHPTIHWIITSDTIEQYSSF